MIDTLGGFAVGPQKTVFDFMLLAICHKRMHDSAPHAFSAVVRCHEKVVDSAYAVLCVRVCHTDRATVDICHKEQRIFFFESQPCDIGFPWLACRLEYFRSESAVPCIHLAENRARKAGSTYS